MLCEISKSLWKPLCGFHRDVISTAVFAVTRDRADRGDTVPLPACRSSFLEPPTRSFLIRRAVQTAAERISAPSWPDPNGLEVLLRTLLRTQVGVDFGAPAPRSAFEDVRVMEQPIEERRDGRGVTQQLPPVVHGSI